MLKVNDFFELRLYKSEMKVLFLLLISLSWDLTLRIYGLESILYRMTALFQVQDVDGMTGVVDDETVMCNE